MSNVLLALGFALVVVLVGVVLYWAAVRRIPGQQPGEQDLEAALERARRSVRSPLSRDEALDPHTAPTSQDGVVATSEAPPAPPSS